MLKDSIEIIPWGRVKDQILAQHPKGGHFAGLKSERLDNIPVIRATYPFGSSMMQNGHFAMYIHGVLTECKRAFMPRETQYLLDYGWKGMPLAIVSKGSFETFIPLPSHVVPLKLFGPGDLMGLYSLYEQDTHSHLIRKAYHTTAGSRSLITLPKISHGLYNQRLSKKFGIQDHLCPKTLDQQWPLFHALAQSPILPSHWRAEVIFFSAEFINMLQKTPELECDFLRKMLDMTAFPRFQAMYDLMWAYFIDKTESAKRCPTHLIEAAKHIIKLGMSEAPGYAPATQDISGPVTELTDILLNVYKLRYHLPIFMEPAMYDGVHPVYYSLHRHTFFATLPEKTSPNRTIDELSRIRELVMNFRTFVLENRFPFSITESLLYRTMLTVEFDFFHPQGEGDLRTDIDTIHREDPRFMKIVQRFQRHQDLEFPTPSVFFNGCIRIRPNPNADRQETETIRPRASMKDFLTSLKL